MFTKIFAVRPKADHFTQLNISSRMQIIRVPFTTNIIYRKRKLKNSNSQINGFCRISCVVVDDDGFGIVWSVNCVRSALYNIT